MSDVELPPPVAWREDDGHWLYYDETNSPETFEHISEHQKASHEVDVFAMYSAEQVRLAVDEALELAAQECDKLGASSCSLDFEDCAAAIRQLKGKP